jgi:hypothetical protein
MYEKKAPLVAEPSHGLTSLDLSRCGSVGARAVDNDCVRGGRCGGGNASIVYDNCDYLRLREARNQPFLHPLSE